jgi:hypothetical protein
MQLSLESDGEFRFLDDSGQVVIPHGKTPDDLQEMLMDLLFVLSTSEAISGEPRGSCWKATRETHLESNPRCAGCSTKRSLSVHHKVPFHLDPSKECDLVNLITLCPVCHLMLGHLKNWSSHNVDVEGDAAWFLGKVRGRP